MALFALALSPCAAAAEPVALTFDDLPTLSLSDDPAYAATTTERLLTALRRQHVPAIGFVVGDKFEDDPKTRTALLAKWRRAGVELGNHTFSHGSPNKMTADDYIADIARDDALLRRLPGHHRPRWFRHPYLETGPTLAEKARIEAWLRDHRYRVAPVTLENADDQFALPYDEAVLHGDAARAAAIKAEYLAYTERCVTWYRQAAVQLLGRRPALVFLLHASRLNADSVGELAAILRSHDLRPAGIDEVMGDPVYRIPEDRADPNGDDWLERWAAILGRDLDWDSFAEPPKDIVAANAQLDVDP